MLAGFSAWLSLGAAMLTVASGCASGPGSPRLIFDSQPRGASVYVEGRYVGRTPTALRLPVDDEKDPSRGVESSARVLYSLPGFLPYHETVAVERDERGKYPRELHSFAVLQEDPDSPYGLAPRGRSRYYYSQPRGPWRPTPLTRSEYYRSYYDPWSRWRTYDPTRP